MRKIDMEPDDRVESSASLGLYPIRVVAAQTGIGVHTLRAWERRYGLPRPTRTAGTHRLYRVEDVVLLRRVQALIARGTPPSRACALVLAESAAEQQAPASVTASRSIPVLALCAQLRAAFIALDDDAANSALSDAFTLFGPESAIEEVIMPVLADIGNAWAEGRVSVAAEHFATTMVRARLLGAMEGGSRNERQPAALLGAGPGDLHEIPTMALALLLRRRGWRTIFLGSSTPFEALRDAISRTQPRLVCLSATTFNTVPDLVEVLRTFRHLPECAAVVLSYGGAPFRHDPSLRESLEGIAIYLGDDLRQAAARAHLLLQGTATPPPAPP